MQAWMVVVGVGLCLASVVLGVVLGVAIERLDQRHYKD